MAILIVDKNGKPFPANAIKFGAGYIPVHTESGIVQVNVSGAAECTRVATKDKDLTRYLTVSRAITRHLDTTLTATSWVSRFHDATVTRWMGTIQHHKTHNPRHVDLVTRELTNPLEFTREVSNITTWVTVTKWVSN